MRAVGSVAGGGSALNGVRFGRAAGKLSAPSTSPVSASVAARQGDDVQAAAAQVLAEQAPGDLAGAQLSREAAASPVLFHGEPGQVADVSKETVEQVVTVNAYKSYMAVFRADDEVKASLVRIKA